MPTSLNIFGECSACSKNIEDTERMVICSGLCGQIFHSTCANLERSVNKAVAHSNNLSWKCDMCCSNYKEDDSSGFKMILNKVFGVMESQRDEIEKLHKEIRGLKKKIQPGEEGSTTVVKRSCKKKDHKNRCKGTGDVPDENLTLTALIKGPDSEESSQIATSERSTIHERPFKANGLDEADHFPTDRTLRSRHYRSLHAVNNFTENVNKYVKNTTKGLKDNTNKPSDWGSLFSNSPLRDLDLHEVWFHFGELKEDVNIDLIEQFLTDIFPQMTTFVTKHEKKGSKKCLKIGVNLKECFKNFA